MICQCLADQLFASAKLATDKSRYFAQPHPIIIVNYGLRENGEYFLFFLFILVGTLNKGMNASFQMLLTGVR